MDPVAPAAPAAPAIAPVETPVVPSDTATPEIKPDRTFTQAELDEILEKRLSKERRKREELKQERDVLRKLALEGREPKEPPKPAEPQASGEPKRESYDSYEAYIEARAEWKAEQKLEAKFAERDKTSKEEQHQAEAEKARKAFKERTKELAKDLTDFDEVMAEATSDPDAPVSRLLADPVNECENPAAVLYHLAKNPDEAERIASLGAAKQAREIWALDTKLKSAPAPKKPSKAPEPIDPVGGKEVTADREPDAKTQPDAWLKWRNKQLAKKRG